MTTSELWCEARYAVRDLRSVLRFTVLTIVVFAPAIGAAACCFSTAISFVLQPISGVADAVSLLSFNGPAETTKRNTSDPLLLVDAPQRRGILAIAACIVPARRLIQMKPAVVLRDE